MTGHPDEGRLQAHLDGELSQEENRLVEEHLGACATCRGIVGELEVLADRAARAVAVVDPPATDVDEALWDVRRRRAGRRTGGHRRRVAAAASFILLVAAGAAAAVPGSPIRAWIEARLDPPDPAVPVVEETVPQIERPEDEASLGVTVAMLDGTVRVSFTGAPGETTLEIEPTGAGRVGVFAPAESRFRTAPGRVEVEVTGPGRVLRVQVPERARLAVISIDGVTVAEVSEGVVVLPGRAMEQPLDAMLRIPLAPSTRDP